MSLIANFGDKKSPIWILLDAPYNNDATDGVILSGGYGYNFKKIWRNGGLSLNDVYISSLRPCIGATYVNANVLSALLIELDLYKPTIIVALSDEILNYLVPETTQAKEKNSSIRKWAGSLLTSKYLSYPHYVISSHPPDFVTANWDQNEIQAYIDFGHVLEEFDYWKRYGVVNPLPHRKMLIEPTFPDLIGYLNDCLSCKMLGSDIETIRPKGQAGSKNNTFYFHKHPGYPYTLALAKSAYDACSFSFWDYPEEQCIKLWRLLDEVFKTVPQIGQNYFLFDAHYLETTGFRLCLSRCADTLIRHHILWPSLKHALHFQTRQYTREPYYKDEGKNFNIKRKKQFMLYNAKDAAVTYEIYERQEEEFDKRPHLR